MSKVADQLRDLADALHGRIDYSDYFALQTTADEIDREHERRMEQQSYDLRKAFCRYIGGVVDDYKHGHKRKSWTAQQKMQLDLDVLRYKTERMQQ